MLNGIVDESTIPTVISELEQMADVSPLVSMGALYILKNELGPMAVDMPRRAVEFEGRFTLPGGMGYRFRQAQGGIGFLKASYEIARDGLAWLAGTDREQFRDRCDRYYWQEIVPIISDNFGDLADTFMNTINEAIINYAEYSFGKRSLQRRVHAHLIKTEGQLAYAIIRPSGTRLRSFNPLALKTREPGSRHLRKRGWGHTLLMERALFISFDHEPRRRGLLVIIGPDRGPSPVPGH